METDQGFQTFRPHLRACARNKLLAKNFYDVSRHILVSLKFPIFRVRQKQKETSAFLEISNKLKALSVRSISYLGLRKVINRIVDVIDTKNSGCYRFTCAKVSHEKRQNGRPSEVFRLDLSAAAIMAASNGIYMPRRLSENEYPEHGFQIPKPFLIIL